MRFITLITISLFLSLCLVTSASGQTQETKPTGSISGRVMLGEQPASGVTVAVKQRRMSATQITSLIKAVTDSAGHFQLTNIAAGTYMVGPIAPGFLMADSRNPYEEGRSVTVDEGETIEDVNFVVKQGGVITGRITDENHNPIVEIEVNLWSLDERDGLQEFYVRNSYMNTTDDRGEYRIYGLPAGRYKISVGELPNAMTIGTGRRAVFYSRTFHSDATDESKAEIIELTDGGEAINIDVSINAKIKSYIVTGRMVDVATGKPVVNVPYGYGTVNNSDGVPRMGNSVIGSNRTNARGEFRLENLMPGHYSAFLVKEENVALYSEPAVFDVKDANVSGIEVKVRSGATINGTAVIESENNQALAQALSQMQLGVSVIPQALEGWFKNPPKIALDGSFHVTGLRAGKVQFYANSYISDKKLFLSRIEMNGTEFKDGIEIKDGEQISGVRLVFIPGLAVIRGQVKIENGELPEGTRLSVSPTYMGGNMINFRSIMPVEVDARGRFVIDRLPAGEYELMLHRGFYDKLSGNRFLEPVQQTVKVAEGADVPVNFVLNLGEKKEK